MKILEERYPKGTIPKQRTDGRYIDKDLKENLDKLSRHIVRDMTWLVIVYSSTLEVGTGKSVFAQQFCEAYLEGIRKKHNIDNRLTMNNIVFRPRDIIERSFNVPKYSVVLCDEWEDAHYWSELGTTLRQFFRKCRQLNLLILIIIPNFFQLPITYAVSRSICAIDVRFSGEFERGFFSFYSFNRKKELYVKGKKNQNYHVVKPNFVGRFADGYVVDEEEYRTQKLKDLEEQEKQEKKDKNLPSQTDIKAHYYRKIRAALPITTLKEAQEALGIAKTTGVEWLHKKEISKNSESPKRDVGANLISNLTEGVTNNTKGADIPIKQGVEVPTPLIIKK